jgi:hypothetical protein
MEEIYKSLFSGHDLLSEQVARHLFDLIAPDGPVMIYVDRNRQFQTTDRNRTGFLYENPEQLTSICNQIDDGDDPCICVLDGGCVVGTQLSTERSHCGYFLLYLAGYASQSVQANLDIFELVLNQAQLICRLIEKNNQLHHLRLAHLSKTSRVLA